MLYVLAKSRAQAREHFDSMGQDMPPDAVVVCNLPDAQGRLVGSNDRIVWAAHDLILDELFFYLTIHLDSERRDQLRLFGSG